MKKESVRLFIAIVGIVVFMFFLFISDESQTSIIPNSQTREIYLFSQVDENINEDKLGIPPDQFSLGTIIVNKGDTVRIHFINLEPVSTQEYHTFTISAPYNIDVEINAGDSTIIEFVADESGIFEYVCTYHEPTMAGQLVVLDK